MNAEPSDFSSHDFQVILTSEFCINSKRIQAFTEGCGKMLHQFTGGPAAFPFPEHPGNSKLILTHQDRSAACWTTVDGNALRFTKIQVQFILDSLEPSDKSAVGTVGIKTEDGRRLIFSDSQGHRFVSGQSEIITDTVFRKIAPHVQSIHPWLR